VKIRKIHGQKKQNNFLILNLIKHCQIFGWILVNIFKKRWSLTKFCKNEYLFN
jgi:hypothetical protein